MAHSGGFEPPTARFVAEYSIQLSYECVVLKTSFMACSQEARILVICWGSVKFYLYYLKIKSGIFTELVKYKTDCR